MLTKDLGEIDWNRPAEELERLVRGLNPWPSAYTFVNGKTLKVWKSVLGRETSDAGPGTVMGTDAQGIHVACKDGVLILTEVELEGKKRMDADAFLRGCRIEAGNRFADKKE